MNSSNDVGSKNVKEKHVSARMALGRRMRELRLKQGLTIAQLASAVQVTNGLISQIEIGSANPSLTSLRKISEALRVPLFYFFIGTGADTRVKSRRERLILRPAGDLVEYEFVSDPIENQVEFTLVRAKPHGTSGDKKDMHPGRECDITLKGRMVLEIEDEFYELKRGDSITFDSLKSHRWVNGGSSELLFVSTTWPQGFGGF